MFLHILAMSLQFLKSGEPKSLFLQFLVLNESNLLIVIGRIIHEIGIETKYELDACDALFQ